MKTRYDLLLDRVLLCVALALWLLGTVFYYRLFSAAANTPSVLAKMGLLLAASLAVVYSCITAVLFVVLPLSHLFKWLRGKC